MTTPEAEQGAPVQLVASVLDEHDWLTPRGYAWPVCTCGEEFPNNDENEVRQHVAEEIVYALGQRNRPGKTPGGAA